MIKEKLFKLLTQAAALCSVVFLFGIIFSIFKEGYAIFAEVGFFKFLFGKSWHPTHYPPEFGILPLIISSIVVTGGALVVSVPLGVGSAIYISELAHPKAKEFLKPLVELLAGVPSVIYGLFGMAFLGPFVSRVFGIPIGLNAFTASIILGIMVIPIISSISDKGTPVIELLAKSILVFGMFSTNQSKSGMRGSCMNRKIAAGYIILWSGLCLCNNI